MLDDDIYRDMPPIIPFNFFSYTSRTALLMAICHGAFFLFCFVCFGLLHIPILLFASSRQYILMILLSGIGGFWFPRLSEQCSSSFFSCHLSPFPCSAYALSLEYSTSSRFLVACPFHPRFQAGLTCKLHRIAKCDCKPIGITFCRPGRDGLCGSRGLI